MNISTTFNSESLIPHIADATRSIDETNAINSSFLIKAESRFGEPAITQAPEFNSQTIS